MKHKNYPIKKNPFKSWDKVFENPKPIKLEEFYTVTLS